MLKNYIVTAVRNISKQKVFSVVNLLGLTIGIAASILIAQYIFHELSYDSYHAKKDQLYRLTIDYTDDRGVLEAHAGVSNVLGPELTERLPEVEKYARVLSSSSFNRSNTIRYAGSGAEQVFNESGIYFVDPDLLEMFDFSLISQGDRLPFPSPNSVLISGSVAEKYFGKRNAIGEKLVHNDGVEYYVSGVFKDTPINSHQSFDLLMPISTVFSNEFYNIRENAHLFGDNYHTYFLLSKKADIFSLEETMLTASKSLTDRSYDNVQLHLQAVTDIHLYSDLIGELKPNGDWLLVYLIGLATMIILILAWSNFINLSIIKNSFRLKEIGVRKTLGASKKQMMVQFITESMLVNLAAILLALGVAELVQPLFVNMIGYELPDILSLGIFNFLLLVLVLISGAILSGVISGVGLSISNPAGILKGKVSDKISGARFGKGIIAFQVASVLVLVGLSFTVYKQIVFMQHKNLGLSVEKVVVLDGPNIAPGNRESYSEAYLRFTSSYSAFKSSLLQNTSFKEVTSSNFVPADEIDFKTPLRRTANESEAPIFTKRVFAGNNYHKVYDLELLAGKFYTDEIELNPEYPQIILNESAVYQLGFSSIEEAVNSDVFQWSNKSKVIGVVKDFHFNSLKETMVPMYFRFNIDPRYISIKLSEGDLVQTLAALEEAWEAFFPGDPYSYFFADAYFDSQYKGDLRFTTIINAFSLLAIFIACLGLYGLAYMSFSKKAKEIGIRKTLGAEARHIIALLYKKHFLHIGLSIIIALPVCYWVITGWLSDYAYRIDISLELFLIPVVVTLFVSLIAISSQLTRYLSINPIDILKNE